MNEREILTQSIYDYQKAIDEAKRRLEGKEQLAKLDKPELVHGDYGYLKVNQRSRLIVRNNVFDELGNIVGVASYVNEYTKLGNIFSDLKGMSQDLEEFRTKDSNSGNALYFSCSNTRGEFYCEIETSNGDTDHVYFNFDGLTEIIQKLQRLRATKRKQNDKQNP